MRSAKEYKAIREEIYRFIGAYITKHTYAPSNKEIAEAVGISGTTVHRHLIDMIDEGILETDAEPGTQRAIRIRNTQVVKRRKKSESGHFDGTSHTRSRGAILSRRQFHSSCQVHTGSQ